MRLLSQHWTSCLLLALAFGGAVGLSLSSHTATTEEREARRDNLFTIFRAEEIREIRVEPHAESQPAFVLQKDTSTADPHAYFLQAEEPVPTDPAALAELLSALEFATWTRRLPEPPALPISAPQLSLHIQGAHQQDELHIWSAAPTPEHSLYAQHKDAQGHVTWGVLPEELLTRLQRDPRSYQTRLLLPYAKSELQELQLQSSAAPETLRLRADASGFMLQPHSLRVDPWALDQLLAQLARSSAEPLLSPEEARALQQQSTHTITVTQIPFEGPRAEVILGGECPGHPSRRVALQIQPRLFTGCVPLAVWSALQVDAAGLQSTRLVPFQEDEVDHIQLESASSNLSLLRKDSGFELVQPSRQDVDRERGQEFFIAWTQTQGRLVAEKAPSTAPWGQATLVAHAVPTAAPEREEKVVRHTLRIWRQGARWLLERQDDGQLLELLDQQAWFLEDPSLWLKDRHLLSFREDELQSLTITQSAHTLTLENQGGNWRSVPPGPLGVDARLLGDKLRSLDHLHVVRWEPLPPADTPILLKISLVPAASAQKETLELQVGPKTRGGHLVWSNLASHAFVLPTSWVHTWETPPWDRSALLLDVSQITQLEIQAGPRTYSFERRGGQLLTTSHPTDRELAWLVEEQLQELQPLAVARLGAALPQEGFTAPLLKITPSYLKELDREAVGAIWIGARTEFQGRDVHFARSPTVPATFYVDRQAVRALLELL